jgi:hypothetical protein
LNSDTTAFHGVLFIVNIAAISSAAASAAVGDAVVAAAVVSIAIVACRFLVNCCVFPPPLPAPTIATVICRRLATVAPATIADPVPSADTAAFLVLF